MSAVLLLLYCLCLVLPVRAQLPGEPYLPNSRCPANSYGVHCRDCDVSFVPPAGVCNACPPGSNSRAGAVEISNCICNDGWYKEYHIRTDQIGTNTVSTFTCVQVSQGTAIVCAENSFPVGGGCRACPEYSKGPIGIVSISNCICYAGYSTRMSFGSDYFDCLQCPAGTYAEPNNPTCQLCSAFGTSLAGSSKIGCSCPGGYSGENGDACAACSPGKYSGFGGATPCLACPGNSTSTNAASSCACKSGFSGLNWNACSPCAAATYKYTIGSSECLDCPANTSSPSVSTSPQACSCIAGFFRDADSTCALCAPGKYKDVSGNQACSACPGSTTSMEGSTTLTECACNAGFSDFSGASGACVACATGTYKTVRGSGPCTNCGVEEVSMDDARQTQRATACFFCRPGTYLNASFSGQLSCADCPANATSPAASQSSAACTCAPGFVGDVNTCTACPAAKYKNTAYCEDQPPGVVVLTKGTRDYLCARGNYQPRANYTAYVLDESPLYCFKDLTTDTCQFCCATCRIFGKCMAAIAPGCTACPATSSPALDTCACNAGFFGPHGWNCTTCRPGTYSKGGQTACTACPTGKYSAAGMTACSDCPPNSYSQRTGSSLSACDCNAGFMGTGGACSECETGKYSQPGDTVYCSSCPYFNTVSLTSTTPTCACGAGHECSDDASFRNGGAYPCQFYVDKEQLCIFDTGACGKCCACQDVCIRAGITPRAGIEVTSLVCFACTAGTYKNRAGTAPCSACPPGNTSNDGLTCVYAPRPAPTTATTTPATSTPLVTSSTPAPTTATTPPATSTPRVTSSTPAPTIATTPPATSTPRVASSTPAPVIATTPPATSTPRVTSSVRPAVTNSTARVTTSTRAPLTTPVANSANNIDILVGIGIVTGVLLVVCLGVLFCWCCRCVHTDTKAYAAM